MDRARPEEEAVVQNQEDQRLDKAKAESEVPKHFPSAQSEAERQKWDAPTNSYFFEMGFHPFSCPGF